MTLGEVVDRLVQIKIQMGDLLDCLGEGIMGEIKLAPPPAKKTRKKRTPKVKIVDPGIIIANILDSSLPGVVKTKRKRRTKKEMVGTGLINTKAFIGLTEHPKNLPEDQNTFYVKPKKKREKKVPVVE